jgi:PAS domain S-box-containing protein
MRDVIDLLDTPITLLDLDARVLHLNPANERLLRRTADELRGQPIDVILPEAVRARGAAFFASLLAQGTLRGTFSNQRPDGTVIEVEVSAQVVDGSDPSSSWVVVFVRDRTTEVAQRESLERRLAAERQRLASAVEQSADAIFILNPDLTCAYMNLAAARIYGFDPEELSGNLMRALDSGVQGPAFWRAVYSQVLAGHVWSGAVTNRRKNGTLVEVESTIAPMIESDGQVSGVVESHRDVTRERQLEASLEREARERDSIEAALGRIDTTKSPEEAATAACAEIVSLTDVDSAAVIDLIPGGEVVLAVAGPVDTAIAAGDAIPPDIARYLRERAAGGAWIQDVLTHPMDDSLRSAVQKTHLQTLAYAPLRGPDGVIGVVGIASHNPAAAPRLVEHMPALSVFGSILGTLLSRRLDARHLGAAERALVAANLDTANFSPFFQPIVDLDTGIVAGFEALTRFTTSEGPLDVFSAARRFGLGLQLETVTTREAITAAVALPAGAFLSLNVSPEFVGSGLLGPLLEGQTRDLVLEITEHHAIENYARMRHELEGLGPGVRVSVDDAGAGFASFRHILELAPAFVKLDIGLVRGIDADSARQALVAGMEYFAVKRKLGLIAEGIETKAELQTLRVLGVRFGQGYLLGRPANGRTTQSWPSEVELPPM